MKAQILALFCSLCAAPVAPAQTIRHSLSLPYISLSAYSRQQHDALSFTGNQAALAQVKKWGAGLYGEQRFMLKEAGVYTLGACVPSRLGNFGVVINYAGFTSFKENRIGVAYGRKLSRHIDLGLQFNYYSYKVAGYGNAAALNFEIGALLHLSEDLHAGIHMYSPVGGKLGKEKEEKLPSVYKGGFGYDASANFFVSAEIVKEEDRPVNVIAGIQYQFAKQLFVKAGIMSGSAGFYAGAGLAWKKLRLDISSGYHPQLGLSPAVLLLLNFKANEK